MAELVGFLAVAAVVICTPGQDTALTIRNTLLGGRRAGIATALGVAGGQAVWTVAAAVGVVAILRASQPAFTVLRLAGAAYLVLLGVQALLAAWRRREIAAVGGGDGGAGPRRALRQGLISNLANAKMVVFFTSLLPQFGTTFPVLLGLGLAFSLLTLSWLAAYAVVVARARRFVERDRVRRALEAVTGTVLVALGLRLAAQQRQ